jgi:hypothetical protein
MGNLENAMKFFLVDRYRYTLYNLKSGEHNGKYRVESE